MNREYIFKKAKIFPLILSVIVIIMTIITCDYGILLSLIPCSVAYSYFCYREQYERENK
jgi:hypothetical protein